MFWRVHHLQIYIDFPICVLDQETIQLYDIKLCRTEVAENFNF